MLVQKIGDDTKVGLIAIQKSKWFYGDPVKRDGRTIWIADAHHDDGKPFVVRLLAA